MDEAYYIGLATAATGVPATNVLASSCYPVANTTCGYFDAAGAGPGTTANFTGSYTVPAALNNVIYVNGNASFTDIKMDNAVVIVTGNLTINASAVGNNLLLHVPSSAASEYPYYGQGLPAIIPCNNNIGDTLGSGAPNYDCNSTTVFGGSTFQFRGFLYVKGDLIVSPGVTWTMAGTLLVGDPMIVPGTGGKLKIATGSTLNVAYDDIINHSIAMSPMNGTAIKIAPDLIQDVPAF